jgi:hypothetical protein
VDEEILRQNDTTHYADSWCEATVGKLRNNHSDKNIYKHVPSIKGNHKLITYIRNHHLMLLLPDEFGGLTPTFQKKQVYICNN